MQVSNLPLLGGGDCRAPTGLPRTSTVIAFVLGPKTQGEERSDEAISSYRGEEITAPLRGSQ